MKNAFGPFALFLLAIGGAACHAAAAGPAVPSVLMASDVAPSEGGVGEPCTVTIRIATEETSPGCWLAASYSSKACGAGAPKWAGAGPDGTLLYYASINPPVEHDGNGGAYFAWTGSAPGDYRVGAQADSGTTAFIDLVNGSDGRCRLAKG
jgi:hypothetical protein